MKMQFIPSLRFVFLGAIFFTGCRAARDVAVTSFRVVDAPANYIRRHIDNDNEQARTTTTYPSDVATPGQPVQTQPPPRTTVRRRSVVESGDVTDTPQQSGPRQTTSSTQSATIPYAKPVPGKPGYVYSPFDPNGGYVDVTGYAAGSKAKDPYSGKIFIVP